MAKQIRLTYNDQEYILEFSRASILEMERKGFVIKHIETKPLTSIPMLFAGSFIKNHRNVSKTVIDALFENVPNKEELLLKLVQMYAEPFETLMSDPDTEKNVEWGADW